MMPLSLRLTVSTQSLSDDTSCCISLYTVRTHELFYGDTTLIESVDGTQLFPCYITADPQAKIKPGEIALSRACLRNLNVQPGQKVTLHIQRDGSRRPYLQCLHFTVHPTTERQDQKKTQQLYTDLTVALRNYFRDAYRPIHEGQRIWIDDVELYVFPRGMYAYGIVTNHTRFEFMRGFSKLQSLEQSMGLMNIIH